MIGRLDVRALWHFVCSDVNSGTIGLDVQKEKK